MAKGMITADLSGLTELIKSVSAMPEVVQKAIELGSEAIMKQGKKDLQRSYVSFGGKEGDYVYRSIDSYGTASPAGLLEGTDYWVSVGVFKIDSIYNEYNQAKQATQKSEFKKNAMTAAQVAYWIENGTSRLASGVRKPKGFTEDAFTAEQLITTSPKPFISNAFVTGWNAQFNAFSVAFNATIKELS